MAVDKSFLIKKIQKKTSMIVAYCAYTSMPFVVCDEETFNDQVYIFENEKLLQDFGKAYAEKKILLRGVVFKNAQFLQFFSSLFTMGVNELVFVNEGANVVAVARRKEKLEKLKNKLKNNHNCIARYCISNHIIQ